MSLVLWSGGCDSTLVLYDLAVSKGTREKPIRALTVSHNSVNARKEQAEARKKILAQFKELGLHVTSSEVEINCLGPDWVVRGGTTQAAIWLSVASTMISDKENLYTGHHDGDQVWIMYACLESALTSLGNSMNKKIEWFVPLVSETKGNIIRRLQDAEVSMSCAGGVRIQTKARLVVDARHVGHTRLPCGPWRSGRSWIRTTQRRQSRSSRK